MIASLLLLFAACISETLHYDLNFAGISAGESTLSINMDKDLVLNSKTKTNKTFSKLLRFEESIILTLDSIDFSTKKIQKRTRQGREKKSFLSIIDYNVAVDTSTAVSKNKTLKIKGKAYHPFGVVYFIRNQEIALNSSYNFKTYDNDRVRNLSVIAKRIENINVSIGEYSCFVLEPKDKLSKGSIRIWLDRVSKIPVQIEMKNKIGTLKMMLKKISP